MSKSFKRGSALMIVAVLMLAVTTVCFAQDPFTKLGRGVANTLTGWVELPKNVSD